jgi:hypothetical protein
VTDEQLRAWAEGAKAAGDVETRVIALIALGDKPTPREFWALGRAYGHIMRGMTQAQAREIVAGWGQLDRLEPCPTCRTAAHLHVYDYPLHSIGCRACEDGETPAVTAPYRSAVVRDWNEASIEARR